MQRSTDLNGVCYGRRVTDLCCRICGHAEGNRTFIAREMMFGMRDEFEYIACAACGCVQIAATPADLSRYYPSDYYSFSPPRRDGRVRAFLQRCRADHLFGRPNPIGWLVARRYGVPSSIEWMRRCGIRRADSVLDIGCGSGDMLLGLRSYGFTSLTGVDPYIERDLDYGNGVRVFKRNLADYTGRHDYIMLHHAFEHMDDPSAVFEQIRNLLSERGMVLIRIPVASSEAFETYGADWVQLDPPRHLYLHTVRSVELLARRAGLDVVGIEYDSTAFQFWGSEQYRKDIPLRDARSYRNDPAHSIFTPDEIAAFEAKALRLNEERRGDQACFFLRHAGSTPAGN